MANLIYPAYVDRLAIYDATINPEIGYNDEIPSGTVCAVLDWTSGDGYTNAIDQLNAVKACARILGHDEKNIGLAVLINDRWIAIDEAKLQFGA